MKIAELCMILEQESLILAHEHPELAQEYQPDGVI
jgi:hypothetical protein